VGEWGYGREDKTIGMTLSELRLHASDARRLCERVVMAEGGGEQAVWLVRLQQRRSQRRESRERWSSRAMRLVLTSDTHLLRNSLDGMPDGDALLVCVSE
jgi:hypothetical protein